MKLKISSFNGYLGLRNKKDTMGLECAEIWVKVDCFLTLAFFTV
jgi:hypothetical protein